ncbi:MAG: beta-ketoacyl synthase chain length factor [Bacteroidales bacterium]|jgi:3-oxoacyl-(acyl-carrier-protein) synthase|nr:beta-ketoacyl synthase chain length factor [Bacteroidales bacterium]
MIEKEKGIVYIRAAAQISIQEPLSDEWFGNPLRYDRVYVRAQEPDYKLFLAPGKLRRMGKVLRRAVVSAQAALRQAGIAMPGAIVSATGLGCIENTEIFLKALLSDGREFLHPACFMQSTHNTIGSLIAIELNCHGYNTTYAHKGASFESALLDAYLQCRSGSIPSALVGGYDEMTPDYHLMLSRIGYWRADGEGVLLRRGEEAFAGETSVSFVLTSEKNDRALCRLAAVEMLYRPSMDGLQDALERMLQQNGYTLDDVDAVLTGVSGNRENDGVYREIIRSLFPGKPTAIYKHVFGESYTASGLGIYAAAVCLHRGSIPQHLLLHPSGGAKNVRRILCYHQYENKNHSFVLLTSC